MSGFQGVGCRLALTVERPWRILSGKVGQRGDNIGVIADVVDKDKEFNGRVEWARWGNMSMDVLDKTSVEGKFSDLSRIADRGSEMRHMLQEGDGEARGHARRWRNSEWRMINGWGTSGWCMAILF